MKTCGNCIWFEKYRGEKIGICRCDSTDEESTTDTICNRMKYEEKIYEEDIGIENNKIFERLCYYVA